MSSPPDAGAPPDHVIDSVTGVDVALPLAGPGARSFAFVIDLHIRVILAIAWYVLAALLYHRRLSIAIPSDAGALWFTLVVAPPAIIFVLYHYVLELAMSGRTPGMRAAGVRLLTRDGSVPSVGALLTRNVFRLIDSFPLFYGVGLIATMVTREHVRIGDLAAGTLLVYDRSDAARLGRVTPGSGFDTASMELAAELLQRWNELDAGVRVRLARQLIGRAGAQPQDAELGAAQLRQRLASLVGSERGAA